MGFFVVDFIIVVGLAVWLEAPSWLYACLAGYGLLLVWLKHFTDVQNQNHALSLIKLEEIREKIKPLEERLETLQELNITILENLKDGTDSILANLKDATDSLDEKMGSTVEQLCDKIDQFEDNQLNTR